MKKILITGAGTGLGKELAIRYGREGHSMILLGRTSKTLEATAQEIKGNGGEAHIYLCDISKSQEVKESISNIIVSLGTIDLLINNAGIGYFGPLEDIEITEIEGMIDVNLKGTILMTRELLPHFKENKAGRIMNIISTAGLRGKVEESVYVASKFGVRGFTESLQKELGDTSIKVTAVYMGGMATPFWKDTDHVKDTSRLKSPTLVADLIYNQDDGRDAIYIDH